jgi:RecA/RadA recombinase
VGRPTTGRATLAMRTVAGADGVSAWVDVPGLLDVDALAAAGADLARVFILRPPAGRPLDALGITAQLVAGGHFSVVVLDTLADLPHDGHTAQALARFLRVVTPSLARSRTAVIVLGSPEHASRPLAHAAALRIGLTRVGLIRPGGVFRGWRTRARILKSPGMQGGELGIEVWL